MILLRGFNVTEEGVTFEYLDTTEVKANGMVSFGGLLVPADLDEVADLISEATSVLRQMIRLHGKAEVSKSSDLEEEASRYEEDEVSPYDNPQERDLSLVENADG